INNLFRTINQAGSVCSDRFKPAGDSRRKAKISSAEPKRCQIECVHASPIASRINSTRPCYESYTIDRQHVGRNSHIDTMRISITNDLIETRHNYVLKTFVDRLLFPEISHSVLNPFEITAGYAAGIR